MIINNYVLINTILIMSLVIMVPIQKLSAFEILKDDRVIRITGPIQDGDYKKFKEVWSTKIEKIVINDSLNGSLIDGLKIANLIIKTDYNIEVNGICSGVCPIVFFIGAKEKIINDGLIVFNGSIKMHVDKFQVLNNVNDTTTNTWKNNNVVIAEQETNRKKLSEANEKKLKLVKEFIKIETEIFKKRNVNIGIAGEEDLIKRNFLYIPTMKSFAANNILNISGKQNFSLLDSDKLTTSKLYVQ